MAVTTKVEPIDRDVQLIISELLSPAARSQQFAASAQEFITEADEINRNVLGRIPPRKVFVDGREGASLDSVRPDGVILAEWELVTDVLLFIASELRVVSPVRSGKYQASHTLFADGSEVPIGDNIPVANEYVFLSDVEYAVKIEGVAGHPPESKQAPKGVYEITALKAARQFGNIAKIRFAWRAPFRGAFRTGRAANKAENRVPAIIVTIGK